MTTTSHATGHPPSAEVARRWAELKLAMLRENDVVTVGQLAAATGATAGIVSEVNDWRTTGRIFAVSDGGQLVYPLFQIKDGRPHRAVLRHLRPTMTDWQIFAWFTAPDGWSCRGGRPRIYSIKTRSRWARQQGTSLQKPGTDPVDTDRTLANQ